MMRWRAMCHVRPGSPLASQIPPGGSGQGPAASEPSICFRVSRNSVWVIALSDIPTGKMARLIACVRAYLFHLCNGWKNSCRLCFVAAPGRSNQLVVSHFTHGLSQSCLKLPNRIRGCFQTPSDMLLAGILALSFDAWLARFLRCASRVISVAKYTLISCEGPLLSPSDLRDSVPPTW